MKDFTKKGTKLPVIPVGTLARTSLLHTNGSEKSFKMATDKKRLVSYGMLDEKWLKCDNPDYNGSDFYLIKLSTIERLAKEQGMYNTNNENMNQKVTLQENGTITVTDTETTTTLSKTTVDEICRLVKEDIEKVKLEVGKWYQRTELNVDAVFCFNGEYDQDGYACGYGFIDGKFLENEPTNGWGNKKQNDFIPASPETVQQYLKAEAEKQLGKVITD